MSMKNSNDTIGIRTHDLPACSAVPELTTPPRNPTYNYVRVRKLAHTAVCPVVLDTTIQRGKLTEYKRVRRYSLQRLLATYLLR